MKPAVGPARLILAGIAIMASIYGLARYAYGYFFPDIRQDFGLGSGVLGLIAGSSHAAHLLATLAAAHVAPARDRACQSFSAGCSPHSGCSP